MRRIASIPVLALLPVLAGCGMAMDSEGKGREDAGPHDGAPDAAVSLAITTEGTPTPEPGDSVTLVAVVTGPYLVQSFAWEVRDPSDGLVDHSTVSATGDRIRFVAQVAGTYFIRCEATLSGTGETLDRTVSLPVESSEDRLTYTARILPSPASGLPPTDVVLSVGDVDQKGLNWQLDSGREVTLTVKDTQDNLLPSVVRLIRTGADPLPRDIFLETGSGKVKVTGAFHALFLPGNESIAPALKSNIQASTLASTWPIQLDGGHQVQGQVLDSNGLGVADAAVTLHTSQAGIKVPSTLAETGADGSFSLRSCGGTAVLTVVPPRDSGLPVAEVKDASLTLSSDSTGWSFAYNAPQPVQVSGAITRSDGNTPARGARLLLTTESPTTVVGTLTIPGSTLGATGMYRRELITDSDGVIQDPAANGQAITVPKGTYNLEVWPGPSDEQDHQGYAASTQVFASSIAKLNLRLGARAQLSGKVVDPNGNSVKARITATSETGSFIKNTADDGTFQLYLNDKTIYRLIIRSTYQHVSTWIKPDFTISGDKIMDIIYLPKALEISGKVTTSGGMGISGALVRLWCSGADCLTHDIVDEARVLTDGTFRLRVRPTTP